MKYAIIAFLFFGLFASVNAQTFPAILKASERIIVIPNFSRLPSFKGNQSHQFHHTKYRIHPKLSLGLGPQQGMLNTHHYPQSDFNEALFWQDLQHVIKAQFIPVFLQFKENMAGPCP